MSFLGNVLWILCGGLIEAIGWFIYGLLFCVTVVGIPIGKQCFKFAALSLAPFGKEIRYGGKTASFIANVIWIVFCGIEMALVNAALGLVLCITIVGIPFGKQYFKLAKLSLMPFGAEIIS